MAVWGNFRWRMLLLGLAAGLVLFFGGQWLFEWSTVREPLRRALSANPAVESFTVTYRPTVVVTVDLAPTEDLRATYRDLHDAVARVVKTRPFKLELRDRRNGQLEEVWYHSQYSIYRAAADGDFPAMADVVEREAERAGARARVFVDEANIYVQLRQDEAYLYAVVPRTGSRATTDAPGGLSLTRWALSGGNPG